MRNLGKLSVDDDEYMVDENGNHIDPLMCVDWQAGPSETAEAINDMLDEFGLELVEYESDCDQYFFSIKKQEPVGPKATHEDV